MDDLNKVRLVLPIGQGDPLVVVDGVEIKGIVAAQLDHDPRHGTVLHLAFVADVDCKTSTAVESDDESETADDGEWADIGTLGSVVYQRHTKTGEQRKVPRK